MGVVAILSAMWPVFLVIGLGLVLRRRGVLVPAGDEVMMRLTVYVTYPCFILHKLIGNEALREPGNVVLPIVLGAGLVVAGLGLSLLAGRLLGLRHGNGLRSFALATAIQNYGYLPIPIMLALFPDGHWAGVLFVYSLGIELALWSTGVMVLTGDFLTGLKRAFNPVVLAVLLGLVLNFLRVETWLPQWVPATLNLLGGCAIPLGLLMAGLTMADLLQQPEWLSSRRTMLGGIFMRLGLLPALMLAAARWLPCSQDLQRVLVVQAAMPAAVFPLILARQYQGHPLTVVRVVLFTTLASLFTIPFVIPWGLRWLGLVP